MIIMAYIPIIYMNVEDQNLIPIIQVKDKDSMRQEREFNINGIKVMAYSRKDALQRLKHKNKRK